METDPTIVEYFAEHESYRCGYCGCKDTNYSHGMWAHQMSVQDYQDLIDRGWRRSGKYCYKPTMNMTCCPQYPIRCNALDFKMNKSHKKLIKRVNRYLITGVQPGSEATNKGSDEAMEDATHGKDAESGLAERAKPSDIDLPGASESKSQTSLSQKHQCSEQAEPHSNSSSNVQKKESSSSVGSTASHKSLSSTSQGQKAAPKPGLGADPNKPACRKAKEIRAERKQQKQALSGNKEEKQKPKQAEKTLEDYLNEPSKVQNPAHRLEFKLMRSTPPSAEFTSTFDTSHKVYQAYQVAVHKDPPGKVGPNQYRRFLCDSPLSENWPGGPPHGYGSFHQHYLLDGKLIAVGVVDILPHCMSSVYLYYDPEYKFLGLGVYSALQEIALIRQLNTYAPDLKFYYMGFYIHSCPKMKYKGQYFPSFLVCPESYSWVPVEKCRPKLDAAKYARLEEEGVEDKDKDIDINQVLCLHKGTMLPYVFYKMMKSKGSDEAEVQEYAGFVGKVCAERMLLVRK